ncbi:glycoside hydrolase family 32 protein [Lewinella sp. IMCC34183]|uniref:glycoside hydrolase family 32 protein n=1 Tax=Lewinella sp. IMCC34183 TaxID=2248762 RepID=UPI000E266CF0|nr:glycoside hydrolase family 32 protein [Lewinella sp. IMCC34183]
MLYRYGTFLSLTLCFLLSCGSERPTAGSTPAQAGDTTATGYAEAHRPQFHFSPPAHWMNDPNGMVYHDGEYHLFYQYYPDSTVWGPMHWGHAVSEDLMHWENLPIALYPDSLGYIFSGSAVVDRTNSSGLGTDGRPPLVAIFTYHDPEGERAGRNDYQSQAIAYSNDNGRSWTKYAGNPVIPNTESIRDFRDPKVMWDGEREQWLMVFAAQDRIMFWRSDNLIDWRYLSDFGRDLGGHGGVWECPDLFPLTVAGEAEEKWVLLVSINPGGPNGGSATQYFVGDFDGTTFTPDPTFLPDVRDGEGVWIDYGRDNYAGVTFSDIPQADGRRIFIGWMSNWLYAQEVPTEAWRSAMTVPRTLELHHPPAGYRLFSTPVRELETLRGPAVEISSAPSPVTAGADGTYEIDISFLTSPDSSEPFGLLLENEAGESYRIGFDPATKAFVSDRRQAGDHAFSETFTDRVARAPRLATSDTVGMHLLLDVASAELFADGGATVMTEIFFPSTPFDRISVYHGTSTRVLGGTGYPLQRIWPAMR